MDFVFSVPFALICLVGLATLALLVPLSSKAGRSRQAPRPPATSQPHPNPEDLVGLRGFVTTSKLNASIPGEIVVVDLQGKSHRFSAEPTADTNRPLVKGDGIELMAYGPSGMKVRPAQPA